MIPNWERLTPSARQALLELAALFDDRIDGEVRVVLFQGAARDTNVTVKPSALAQLRKRTS